MLPIAELSPSRVSKGHGHANIFPRKILLSFCKFWSFAYTKNFKKLSNYAIFTAFLLVFTPLMQLFRNFTHIPAQNFQKSSFTFASKCTFRDYY